MQIKLGCCVVAVAALLAGCGAAIPSNTSPTGGLSDAQPSTLARPLEVKPPKHVVIVVEENHSYEEIAGNPEAPYINSLMGEGANFTDYHGIEHPSQPNYLDLFSGSNQGVTDDSCPHTFTAPNLGSELFAAHYTFGGYAEDLPSVGYNGCSNGHFWWPWGATNVRRHCPWVNFTTVPKEANMPFSYFPRDFSKLPTVSFVIPNLKHDMHSGSIAAGDAWLRQNIGPYVEWAKSHDSLLIVTWDEDDNSASNHIPTFFVGPMIRSGEYHESVNHFNLLRTIEDLYGLPYLGQSRYATPIRDIWR